MMQRMTVHGPRPSRAQQPRRNPMTDKFRRRSTCGTAAARSAAVRPAELPRFAGDKRTFIRASLFPRAASREGLRSEIFVSIHPYFPTNSRESVYHSRLTAYAR